MSVIRVIQIENFRAIQALRWLPGPGVNCLVGPGDSGKSTIIDAIDLCLGARRTVTFTDADFHNLEHEKPICIRITIGELEEPLRNMESYGDYLVGYSAERETVEPEPGDGLETALTIQLKVEGDLEPEWTLISPRAEQSGRSRSLAWADRLRGAPARLGVIADNHLTWRRGSVLSRLTEDKPDTSAQLAEAAREMRNAFDQQELKELEAPMKLVTEAANRLGVPVGDSVQALIDAGSVTFSGGTISLHDEEGVPLRSLGLGSARLLIAGLQRAAAKTATTFLVDELESGLEPHRIIRFLGELGAKDKGSKLQVFATSHSPVAVAELSDTQLYIVRAHEDDHVVLRAHDAGDVQGTIRLHPHALLARSIVVAEGATEIGLLRGLDQHFDTEGELPMTACGATIVNGGGDETYARALALQALGYRVAILRDSDKPAPADKHKAFEKAGGEVFTWSEGLALEHELFNSLEDDALDQLLAFAISVKGRVAVADQIRNLSKGTSTLEALEAEIEADGWGHKVRTAVGDAAAKSGWFKHISVMEDAALTIIGPGFNDADDNLTDVLDSLFAWIREDAE